MKELRVVIADDWAALREVIRRTLSGIEGCNVVGMAADGVEALQLVRELKPHLLVLDVTMPRKDGFEVLKEIRRVDSETVIVMFTADPALRDLCLAAGANFFLDKTHTAALKVICRTMLLAS